MSEDTSVSVAPDSDDPIVEQTGDTAIVAAAMGSVPADTRPAVEVISEASTKPSRRRRLAWLLLVGGLVLLAVEIHFVRPELVKAGRALSNASPLWVVAALAATLLSMHCFGRQQRRMLMAATPEDRPRPSVREMVSLAYSANAVNMMAPAGGPVSAAYVVQRLRARGHTTTAAGFTLVASGVLSSVTFGVLAAVYALVTAGSSGAVTVGLAVPAVLLLVAIAWLFLAHARRGGQERFSIPTPLRCIEAALRLSARVINRVSPSTATAVLATADQLRVVRPTARDWVAGASLAAGNWLADLVCLDAACHAVGLHPKDFMLALIGAYLAGMTASGFAFLPGGFGVIEVAMIATLHGGGVNLGRATAAVLLYRLVSCLFVVAVGSVAWIGGSVTLRRRTAAGEATALPETLS